MTFSLLLRSAWRREARRPDLWLCRRRSRVIAAVWLYVGRHALNRPAYEGGLTTPSRRVLATADAAREILTTLAGVVITGPGLVFSITIVPVTQASTRYEPRRQAHRADVAAPRRAFHMILMICGAIVTGASQRRLCGGVLESFNRVWLSSLKLVTLSLRRHMASWTGPWGQLSARGPRGPQVRRGGGRYWRLVAAIGH